MANHKTGVYLTCLQCKKEFYIIRSRINLCKTHFCSRSCSTTNLVKDRKVYPKKVGSCLYCNDDIIAKNAQFNKPSRKFCSYKCGITWRNKNIPKTEYQMSVLREGAKKRFTGKKNSIETRKLKSESQKGSKSHFWKGGLTEKNRKLRNSLETKLWRESIFQRDDWTCQHCKIKGNTLEAHHLKPWSKYPELRFTTSNGVTLCKTCHRKTDTFGNKKYS